jgi:SAM-dependent methyltransferase
MSTIMPPRDGHNVESTTSESWDIGRETLNRISQMRRFNAWMISLVRPHVHGNTLEFGAGIGSMTALLAESADAYSAVDISADYVSELQVRFGHIPQFRAVQCDIQSPEVRQLGLNAFDCIVCLNVLEHIADDGAVIANSEALLRSGGRLVLLVPALAWLYGSLDRHLDHYRRYDRGPLCELLRQHELRPVACRWFNLFGLLGWYLNARVHHGEILPSAQLGLYDRLVPAFRTIERLTGPPIGQSLLVVAEKP